MKLLLHRALWVFFLIPSLKIVAQNGKFDARFLWKNTDCIAKKVYVQVQVRAHDLAHTFKMGDANFRFEYDPRMVANPEIFSQDNFSIRPPSNNANYGTQNLNGSSAGSTKGIVSLNIFYTGAAENYQTVSTNWLTVSTLAFDILDTTACFNLVWHDDKTFPITGMSEVIVMKKEPYEFTLEVVKAAGYWENMRECHNACNNKLDTPSVKIIPIVTTMDSAARFCYIIMDKDAGDTFSATPCNVTVGSADTKITDKELCITYKPKAGFIGKDTICLTLCDRLNHCREVKIPVVVTECNDKQLPVLTCPDRVEVNIFGEILSNRHNFIKEVRLTDDCSGVAIFYNMPKAVDDCSKTPSVILYNGVSSGSVFTRGSTALVFEAKDEKGNLAQCQVEVKVSEPARLILTDKDTLIVCKGNDLILSGLPITNAKYEWRGPNNFTSKLLKTTVSKVQLASGTYQFKSTIGQCIFDDSIHVTHLGTPIANHDFYELQPGEFINKSILLNDTFFKNIPFQIKLKSGVTQGDLTFNNDGSFKYTAPAKFTGNETFTYELCQNDCPNNCAQAVANIKVQYQGRIGVKATNVITPNGDDINDYLTIVGFDHTKPDNKSEMSIFNQWGDLVHRSAPYKNDWNGYYKNNPLPDGTYYFIFYSAPGAEPIKDFVTIMR